MAERNLSIAFSHPVVPPSFNAVGHTGNRWAWTRAKKEWQGLFELLLMQTGMPRNWAFIEAKAVLTFHVKRKRDEGNYRTILEKCLGDALVNGGWLADDTPEHFRFVSVTFDPEPGEPKTLIELECQ